MQIQVNIHVTVETDDVEILAFINDNPGIKVQVEAARLDLPHNDMIMPIVMRKSPAPQHYDLYVLVCHHHVEADGRWICYQVKDFIRNKVDIGPMVDILSKTHKVKGLDILGFIKAQIKLLNMPENADFPHISAQMVHAFIKANGQ